jgi:hypothetical protein
VEHAPWCVCDECMEAIIREYARGEQPTGNGPFERHILKDLGMPEDYKPKSEAEAYRLVTAWMED